MRTFSPLFHAALGHGWHLQVQNTGYTWDVNWGDGDKYKKHVDPMGPYQTTHTCKSLDPCALLVRRVANKDGATRSSTPPHTHHTPSGQRLICAALSITPQLLADAKKGKNKVTVKFCSHKVGAEYADCEDQCSTFSEYIHVKP